MVNNNHPVDIPKTYTVAYFDEVEWSKGLNPQEIAQQQELADLQNQLLSQEKGYGPCGDSRCYGSNACLPGESFYPLYTSCPAEGCPGKWKETYWVHAKSGCGYSNDKISNKFRIRCPDCFNTSHIQYHKFSCPEHVVDKHKDTYWWTSTMSFMKAFAVVHSNREIPTEVYLQMIVDLRKPENQWVSQDND